MYTPTQLESIKIFGRKDLSFGCIFKYWDIYTRYCYPWTSFHIVQKLNADTYAIWNEDFKKIEILWHEPHLEDVFRVAKNKWKIIDKWTEYWIVDFCIWWHYRNELSIVFQWWFNNDFHKDKIMYNPTLQLLEQSEETLNKLISLFE